MANDVEKDNYLQKLLKSYLDSHPGSERTLADEFRTAVGTITRWANGHSHPARQAQEKISRALEDKIYIELRDTLRYYLTDNLQLELAKEFEVATSTVRRWANFTAFPHPRLALMIIKYVKSKETK